MWILRVVRPRLAGLALLASVIAGPVPAAAQGNPPAAPPTDSPVLTAPAAPPEIDLTLINLPTTLSMKPHRGYFRLTHRFARDLRRGTFDDLAASLFSLDDGAVIGLEYRYAITGSVHAGIARSLLSKTIETFARWDAVRQGGRGRCRSRSAPRYEGLNNLRANHQPGVAVTVSRTFGDVLALYATPSFVAHTHAVDTIAGHEGHDHDVGLEPDEHAGHDSTWFAGLGGRVRFSGTGYLVGEYLAAPRRI